MSTHLITGFAGKEHITSADQGSFNAAVMGGGEFVLERGEQFRCQVISNNKVRIYDGDILMQGRHIMIDRNTYEETMHENGTQGYLRNDLIVLTYEKNSTTGIETAKLEVIKGTPAESNPTVPEYVSGDILDGGALKNQMPLYKVPFNGLSIGVPVKMFSTVPTLEGMKNDVDTEVDAKMKELDNKFATLEGGIDEKIAEAGKPLSSNASDWKMIQNYGEYSADAKTVGEEFTKVNSSLIGYPDMSQKIYSNKWQKSFEWTATQDCWVYGACDTRTTTYASIICLNDAPVVSALTDNSTIAQSGSLFICKKGDVISKTVNGDSIARIDAYAMRV